MSKSPKSKPHIANLIHEKLSAASLAINMIDGSLDLVEEGLLSIRKELQDEAPDSLFEIRNSLGLFASLNAKVLQVSRALAQVLTILEEDLEVQPTTMEEQDGHDDPGKDVSDGGWPTESETPEAGEHAAGQGKGA